jgi:hypothetical protein
MKGWHRQALRKLPGTTFNASMIPVPNTVREFKSHLLLLKTTIESLYDFLLKVTLCVSVDFSWEMGEGRELNSSFDWPSFWLKQQKTVQLSH